ncbi:hypothetical protein Lery_0976 [Legionella erythra]|uniref:Uncharacterized protein n=1 Tax=Legionella erythra TaxID=448 RepID=A0A0W0TRX0_LEGER|nr:hypothetical protein Lery_0976 [Legionella erythra]
MGIEPTLSAWKAEVLPLNYTRLPFSSQLVEGEGFEPSKAEPSDLQSDPFDRSGTPPKKTPFSFRKWLKSSALAHGTRIGGAGTRNRTRDLLITSQLLYQLSYASITLF